MPKVTITDSKGLVQETGSGIDIRSVGAVGTVVAAAQSITSTGAGNTDFQLAVPAGALIVDAGVIITTAVVVNSAANITCTVGVGSAGNADLSASANIGSAVTAIPINTAFGTSIQNEGAATLSFKTTAPLHRTADTTVFIRVANDSNNVTAGAARAFVRYMMIG